MIPVLFPSNATAFTTNGFGRLSDAISCKVEEERNGKYELEMEYPADGIHFDLIEPSQIIYALPYDGAEGPQPFMVYDISKPIGGRCTIRAEHISYRLLHVPVMPFGQQTAVAQALQGLKTNAAESCPFTFWTDKTSAGTFEVKEPKSIRACLGGESGSILQAFGGGEYMWDGFTVKLYQQRGADNGVVIRYGKNITDLTQDESIAETINGVCPYWHGTDSSENEVIVTLPEKVLHSTNAENYPYNRTAVLDCTSEFETQPTESQLRTFAQSYMAKNNIGIPKINLTVKFVPLWQSEEYKGNANIERVKLCDTVTIKFEKLGVSAVAKVVRTKYNVLAERYEEIELGDAKSSMVKSMKQDISGVSDGVGEMQSTLRQRMIAAINQIMSSQDGDIVFTYDDTTGQRTNILAMDSSDPSTARKILMINYGGIGGFSNGMNDSSGYTLAITTDGKVNAEAINTGTLLAALVLGNVLKIGGNGLGGNGVLEVYDANNNRIGKWDKNGIEAEGSLKTTSTYTRYYYDGNTETLKTAFSAGTVVPSYSQTNGHGFAQLFEGKSGRNPKNYLSHACYVSHISEQHDSNGYEVYGTDGIIKDDFDDDVIRNISIGNSIHETIRATQEYIKTVELIMSPLISVDSDDPAEWGSDPDNQYYGIKYDFHVGVDEIALVGQTLCDRSDKYGMNHFFIPEIYYAKDHFVVRCKDDSTATCEIMADASENLINIKAGNATLNIKKYSSSITATICNRSIQLASSSSRRYKHDIKPIEDSSLDPHRLLKLEVKQFAYNDDHIPQYVDMRGKTIPGLIAEEVDNIYPAATIHNEDGGVESWDERRIIPGMLALIQEQAKKIEDLEKRIIALEKKA